MGGPTRQKKKYISHKLQWSLRVKHRTKNLDEVEVDLQPENAEKLLNAPIDVDLPGLGRHYCVECAKHFADDNSLMKHAASKTHKKRIRQLQEGAYTHDEAFAAVGRSAEEAEQLVGSKWVRKAYRENIIHTPSNFLAIKTAAVGAADE